MASSGDKAGNLEKAKTMAVSAAEKGAKLIIFPELFNYLPERIAVEGYRSNAESLKGQTIGMLTEIAENSALAIVAGSIIESSQGKLFNTSCLITPGGKIEAYRKVHLFNYGGIAESSVFLEGEKPKVAEYGSLKIGLTTCFDLRFPELYRAEALMGARLITNVAAFLEKTGKAHWMVLLRARAIENQLFIVAANQAKSGRGGQVYYGNSAIIDPWGRIIARAGEEEQLLVADVELDEADRIRNRMPIFGSRRPSAYSV
jgi:predicted amidohydrolase